MLSRLGPRGLQEALGAGSGLEGAKGRESVVADTTHPAWVRAADATLPRPVPNVLEFNAPVHENWNIVHTGMLIPEVHQIYVCADNCLRGVVLTAAEMGLSHRFSGVTLEEDDLYDNLETATIEGVSDVIDRLPSRPPAVMVFLVCLHHFVGTDVAYVYRELERRYPDICFMRCWMDPIMQKTGITPEQKERKAMLDPLQALPEDRGLVALVGDDLRLPADSDLALVLEGAGLTLRQVHDCQTYQDYLGLGAAQLFLTRSPFGDWGLRRLGRRMGRPTLYLQTSLTYRGIDRELARLAQALGIPAPDAEDRRLACDAALDALARELEGVPVAIDYLAVNHPLDLARTLLEHGIDVRRVYLDAVSPEEGESLDWLRTQAPDLELWSTIHPTLRQAAARAPEGPDPAGDGWLAVGPKAAWFCGTSHFVNVIETDGMWGYSAIRGLARLMDRAWRERKDARALVPRKGLGMPCVCQLPRPGAGIPAPRGGELA